MTATEAILIMLVDDNDIDLFLNKKFLKVSGITENTVSFMRAKEALNYLENSVNDPITIPDFILLDIQMPEINGFQFVELFMDLPEPIVNKTKIIMVSSTLDPIDQDRVEKSPVVLKLLKKPLDPDELRVVTAYTR